MRRKYVLLYVILCLCISCNQPKQPINYERASYFINLDSIKREGVLKTSDIFKKINVIILEKHDYAIISDISSFAVFDNQIFILDNYKVGKLFVFDKTTGKYLRQIGTKGEGPEEYRTITDFCIDPDRKEIYVMDDFYTRERIHKYDIETGKYISYISIPSDDVWYRYIAFNAGKLYLNTMYWARGGQKHKNDNRIMEIDIKTRERRDYISGNKYNFGWNKSDFTYWNFFASKNTPLKYVEEYMNTVFAIDKDTVYPYLTVKHKDWATQEFLDAQSNFDPGTDIHPSVVASSENVAFHLHSYFEWDDYIYFEYRQKRYYPILYNKKTGEIRHYEDLDDDLFVTKKGILFPEFLYANSTAVYDYIYPGKLFWYQHPETEFAPNLDKREEVIKELASDDEPIMIFEYVFK
jgi:hypothetical protein